MKHRDFLNGQSTDYGIKELADHLYRGQYFDVTKLDKALERCGIDKLKFDAEQNQDVDALRRWHCIDWSAMSDETRTTIINLCAELLGIDAELLTVTED